MFFPQSGFAYLYVSNHLQVSLVNKDSWPALGIFSYTVKGSYGIILAFI